MQCPRPPWLTPRPVDALDSDPVLIS